MVLLRYYISTRPGVSCLVRGDSEMHLKVNTPTGLRSRLNSFLRVFRLDLSISGRFGCPLGNHWRPLRSVYDYCSIVGSPGGALCASELREMDVRDLNPRLLEIRRGKAPKNKVFSIQSEHEAYRRATGPRTTSAMLLGCSEASGVVCGGFCGSIELDAHERSNPNSFRTFWSIETPQTR